MDEIEILRRVNDVAAQHFNVQDVELTRESVAGDVKGWDSLAHIEFLTEIEKAFRIRFKAAEISSFANVGQLVSRIATKLGG